MNATVIFDLDGLLTDTERLHCAAYCRALSEVGVALDEATYAEHWIRHGRGIVEFCAERALPHTPEALRARKAALYTELVAAEARPMPGALELLAALRDGRRRIGLATSAFRDAALAVIAAVGIARYFDAVATGDDVTRIKPHPDLFLRVAAQLDAPPARCVVLEDAEKGVLAARAAGMPVVAVPNDHTRANDFTHATRVVASLREVTPAMLDALVAGAPAR